jgi:Zn-dependent metalloprotease
MFIHHDPIQCIIPPYMLKNMLANGDASQKVRALAIISASAQLRAQRAALAESVAYLTPINGNGKQRKVYSTDGGSSLPGKLIRDEGQPEVGDPGVNEAYEGAGATYDLYWEIYQRDSVDGNGLRLDSTVHYQKNYDNAFWNGEQMVYGDGDGQIFNRFTLSIDVIGHELTHGVTQYTSNLNYSNQSGALNEAFSDIFGSLVKQRRQGQAAADADWLIGAGLFTASVKGVALRSMKAPGTAYDDPLLGKDPQPAHMRDYVNTSEDNGGVHINSGIPNHAFYLMATAIGGFAWEKTGKIWYLAARDKFKSSTNFQNAADLTFQVAGELFGAESPEQKAVQYGWEGVGITIGAQGEPQPQPQPDGCLAAPALFLRSLLGGSPKG